MNRPASMLLYVTLSFLSVTIARAADSQTINITADSYKFEPDTITVKTGQPVTFNVTNKAWLIPHNLIVKAPEAGIDIKIEVRPGKTASATFTPTTPGTYEVYCGKEPPFGKTHKERGMHGKLIVE
jgi:plastocyanin